MRKEWRHALCKERQHNSSTLTFGMSLEGSDLEDGVRFLNFTGLVKFRKMSFFSGGGAFLSKVSGFISSVNPETKAPHNTENAASIPGSSLVAR